MKVLKDADLSHRPVKNPMRCIYCHWYRPKENLRCFGFINSDVDDCIDNNFHYYATRARRIK